MANYTIDYEDGRIETGETEQVLEKQVGVSNKGKQGIVHLPKECIGKKCKILVVKDSMEVKF